MNPGAGIVFEDDSIDFPPEPEAGPLFEEEVFDPSPNPDDAFIANEPGGWGDGFAPD